MIYEAAPEQAVADRREASRAKRVGQTCITLFVVFVVSLLSFGKPPVGRAMGVRGSGINLDLFSCLGVGMGIFALVFMLLSFKRIMRLSALRKILGMIGGAGLITHTILALFFPLSYGGSTVELAERTANRLVLQAESEEWVIDGKTYSISSSYYLQLPEGLQFTIEYPYQFGSGDRNMDDARALEIAFPMMRHAYSNDLYKRSSVTKLGEGKMIPSRIGVVLYEKQGGGTRGYRIALSLSQIRERMERETLER